MPGFSHLDILTYAWVFSPWHSHICLGFLTLAFPYMTVFSSWYSHKCLGPLTFSFLILCSSILSYFCFLSLHMVISLTSFLSVPNRLTGFLTDASVLSFWRSHIFKSSLRLWFSQTCLCPLGFLEFTNDPWVSQILDDAHMSRLMTKPTKWCVPS